MILNKIKAVFKQAMKVTDKVYAENGGTRCLIMLDVMLASICYGASPNNYYYFGFYKMPAKKRKTYVTHKVSKQLIKRFNHPEYIFNFEKKQVFNHRFNDLIKRNYLDLSSYTEDEFDAFYDAVKGDEKVIYKPTETAQGTGIVIIGLKGKEALRETICPLDKNAVLEQWIHQDERVSAIYAGAVNCLRVITLLNDGKFYVLASNFTFGNAGHLIANASLNNLVCLPDLKTGVIQTDAQDIYGKLYEVHPVSKLKFKGFQIPYWDAVLSMCEDAARRIPQVGYIGWDIAISPEGPVIIEGNTTPGYKFFQLKGLLPEQIGNKERYEFGAQGK